MYRYSDAVTKLKIHMTTTMDNITSLAANQSAPTNIHANPSVKAVAFLTCFWIIVSHSFIIFCFTVNRSKPWTNYSKQILSLSINDLCVGIVCLLLLILFSIETGVNYWLCSFTFFVFFAALCACMYHVSAICIYRALTLIRKPTNTRPTSYKLSVLLVTLAWVTSFCLCAVPFIVWHKDRRTLPICFVDMVFEDDLKLALGLFVVCYIIPMLCTNIIYALTCCKLLMVWRKIFPNGTADNMASTTENPPNMLDTLSHGNRSGVRAQRKTVGTIGVLLLLFNLFSIPFIVLMSAQMSGISTSRDIRVLASVAFIMNSVTSPFVYAIRTKFLRNAMKDLVKECVSCVMG